MVDVGDLTLLLVTCALVGIDFSAILPIGVGGIWVINFGIGMVCEVMPFGVCILSVGVNTLKA